MSEVAIVGSGGREFALGSAVSKSDLVGRVHFLNGNAGTAELPKSVNHNGVKPVSLDEIVTLVKEKGLFTIIGPEAPLVAGLADRLRAEGLLAFGPSQEASQLESSKAYALELAREVGVSFPYSEVTSDLEEAEEFIGSSRTEDYVIKADGLAAGKGVVLPNSSEEALETVEAMLSGKMFGEAGKTIIFQERLHGPEVSALAITDGERIVHLPMAQDHKRLLDGDKGPNTGGMGAYAPVPGSVVTYLQAEKIRENMEKAILGMKTRGTPFVGVLYGGFMLATEYGGTPQLLEFNVRFGDPETQAIIPLLQEAGIDIYELLRSAAEGNLKDSFIHSVGKAALTVCLASEGYPDTPKSGDEIYGLDREYEGANIQHAGTANKDGKIVTAGGRVLYVTGLGKTANEAASSAYSAIGKDGVHFDGMQYRTDIGHQVRTA